MVNALDSNFTSVSRNEDIRYIHITNTYLYMFSLQIPIDLYSYASGPAKLKSIKSILLTAGLPMSL